MHKNLTLKWHLTNPKTENQTFETESQGVYYLFGLFLGYNTLLCESVLYILLWTPSRLVWVCAIYFELSWITTNTSFAIASSQCQPVCPCSFSFRATGKLVKQAAEALEWPRSDRVFGDRDKWKLANRFCMGVVTKTVTLGRLNDHWVAMLVVALIVEVQWATVQYRVFV